MHAPATQTGGSGAGQGRAITAHVEQWASAHWLNWLVMSEARATLAIRRIGGAASKIDALTQKSPPVRDRRAFTGERRLLPKSGYLPPTPACPVNLADGGCGESAASAARTSATELLAGVNGALSA